jgi:hypothetical protein
MLSTLMGDWEVAEEHFEAAIAMDAEMHAWPWLAHAQHDYATMLRKRGRQSDLVRTDNLMSEALAAANRLGIIALRDRIHKELS